MTFLLDLAFFDNFCSVKWWCFKFPYSVNENNWNRCVKIRKAKLLCQQESDEPKTVVNHKVQEYSISPNQYPPSFHNVKQAPLLLPHFLNWIGIQGKPGSTSTLFITFAASTKEESVTESNKYSPSPQLSALYSLNAPPFSQNFKQARSCLFEETCNIAFITAMCHSLFISLSSELSLWDFSLYHRMHYSLIIWLAWYKINLIIYLETFWIQLKWTVFFGNEQVIEWKIYHLVHLLCSVSR